MSPVNVQAREPATRLGSSPSSCCRAQRTGRCGVNGAIGIAGGGSKV